jgi:hypothetical protein
MAAIVPRRRVPVNGGRAVLSCSPVGHRDRAAGRETGGAGDASPRPEPELLACSALTRRDPETAERVEELARGSLVDVAEGRDLEVM